MKKSYHSTVLPMQDAMATLWSMAGDGLSCSDPTVRSAAAASFFMVRSSSVYCRLCQPVKSRCTLVMRPGSFSARSKARQVFSAGIVGVIVPADFQPALCELLDDCGMK